MKIGIFADFSKKSGLGHFKRMSGLARELKKLNTKCYFFIDKKNFLEIKKKIDNKLNYIILKNYNFSTLLFELNSKKIKKIIFDSYNKKFLTFEKKLKIKKINVIAIDDKLLNHNANLVFTNRELDLVKINTNIKQRWYTGFKYILTESSKKYFPKKINTKKKIKILFYAGGTEDYSSFNKFYKYSFKFLEKKHVDINVLFSTNKSIKYFRLLTKNIFFKKKINFVSYKKESTTFLKKFDLVCGPLGVTTFETILAGSFPFTFLRNNNLELNTFYSWAKNGHLINLSKDEIADKNTILKTWDFVFKNLKKLKNILIKNSKKIDGKGNLRVAKLIINQKKLKKKSNKNYQYKNLFFNKCDFGDLRNSFIIRNQKNNIEQSISNKKIFWPEHLNWFLDEKIKKFKITYKNNIVSYAWYKSIIDNKGKIFFSGISIDNKYKLNIKTILYIAKKLRSKIVNNYKRATWIVINKKENYLFDKINLFLGLKNITHNNSIRLKKLSRINFKNFNIRELNL